MSFKEVTPAFIWAGIVVSATSLAMAWTWYGDDIEKAYYSAAYFVGTRP
jgi:hypothetical protein